MINFVYGFSGFCRLVPYELNLSGAELVSAQVRICVKKAKNFTRIEKLTMIQNDLI
jgi:hypothetical protein